MPGRDNRDPDGKAQQRSGLRQQGADRLACFNQPREQAARQAGRLQDWRAEIALPQIEHLAGARHGEVGGELPGQPVVDQRRNKQPGMGLRQQLRVALFSQISLYRVLNANAPTPAICCSWCAGIYWLIFSITAAVRGHFQLMIGYSRAPAHPPACHRRQRS